MTSAMKFLDCPAYLDETGTTRCGLPAEVESWFTMRSTSGPLESAKIRCPLGHWFSAPVEFLVIAGQPSWAERTGAGSTVFATLRRLWRNSTQVTDAPAPAIHAATRRGGWRR